MKFKDILDGDVVTLDVSGKIMGGEETTMFHGKIHEYINQNKKYFVVDLKNVDWMNSVGLGMLISSLTTVKNSGGRLVLPVALHNKPGQAKPDWAGTVMCYLSDDVGQTWRRSKSTLVGRLPHQTRI